MTRYFAIAIGLGLLLVATSPGPALAQGPLKPVQSVIINGTANPVPVTVVPPPPQTSVTCTTSLPTGNAGGSVVQISLGVNRNSFVCSGGVTSVDVSRVVYTPHLGGAFIGLYRLTVIDHMGDGPPTPQDIVAFVTDGAPDAAVVRPYRLDSTASGTFQVNLNAAALLPGGALGYGGVLIFIGTPAQ